MKRRAVDYSVYVVTDRRTAGDRDLVAVVEAAVSGGATVVQLREKASSTRDWLALGRALHRITRRAGVPLIVNDRIDVALALDAEGVHVGQDDMPAGIARRLIGPDKILGVSTETLELAREAAEAGADYLGVGDIFGTPSKPDAGPPIGLARLAEIARKSEIPVVGIGGITLENAASVIAAGAVGVAVISAVIGAPDPAAAAQRMRGIVNSGRLR
ncbi:TPA: thiamine phosphate synthase [Candidatus Acetothermia bacterium]|nr:thiamine phosphate synthase [Candidatus Acetothermia bacterium]